jgi:phage baseplate assembly protein W|tara:strand:- start:2608 stop:3039 length:432 start_codon:yes stop_codon:yes gene_type:complete
MAILERRNININPIDLPQNDKVAVGVTFPFDGRAVFNSSYTTKEQVKSNLINLLLTSPGERLMNPEFGIGIRQYLFEQVIDKQFLKDKITDKVQIYIPEIEIDDVFIKRENLETTPEIHTIRISLYYKVLADRSTDAILLNFN